MSIADVLRRGFDNMVANWPVLVARLVETLVTVLIVGLGIVAALLLAFGSLDIPSSAVAVGNLRAVVITGVIAIFAIVGILLLLLDAFVTAANAAIYLDGEQAASESSPRQRAAYAAFTMPRWLEAGRAFWSRIVRIYLILGAITLALFAIVFALMLLFRDENGFGTCCTAAFFIPLLLAAMLMIAVCGEKAIIVCVYWEVSATDGLREAWDEVTERLGVHCGTAIVIGLTTFGCAIVIAALGAGVDAALPFEGVGSAIASLLQNAVSIIASCWLLAAFAALRPAPLPGGTAGTTESTG